MVTGMLSKQYEHDNKKICHSQSQTGYENRRHRLNKKTELMRDEQGIMLPWSRAFGLNEDVARAKEEMR